MRPRTDRASARPCGPRPTCGQIVRKNDFTEGPCGRPAVAIIDAGTAHGYPVCADCARLCHPDRLTRLDEPRSL